MMGGCAVKYQSVIARICTREILMSRLLSWDTYLPQYGTLPPAGPRPPPWAPAPGVWSRRSGAGVFRELCGGAGLAAMESTHNVIVGLRRCDQPADLFFCK